MVEKVGYKKTEVGDIPEDWDEKTFGEIFTGFVSGQTPSRSKPEFFKGNIPWITSGELNHGVVNDSLEKITEEAIENSNIQIFPKGTFIFAIIGLEAEGTRGNCAITGIDATINQSCMALLSTGKVSINYLFYYYEKFGNPLALRYCQGTKQQNYSGRIVRKLPIVFPKNHGEQRAIAIALSDINSYVSLLEHVIDKKRDLKHAAIQALLSGKRRLPGFSDERLCYSMTEVCWFQEGPGVRDYQFTQTGVKLLNGTNIFRGEISLDTTFRHISMNEAFGPYSHFLALAGDIVIASSGISIDKFHEKVAIICEKHLPLCMNTSTIRFRSFENKLNLKFLYYFLMSDSFKNQIGIEATGSAQLNFGPSHIAKVVIWLPKFEEQIAIATVLSEMDAELTALEQKRDKTEAIKQGMMQELLTGRVRLT